MRFPESAQEQSHSKKPLEQEISSAFTSGDDQFDLALSRIKGELQTQREAPFADVQYDKIFDDKVLSFLGTKDVKTAIEEYVRRYNELLAASTYFKKGTFEILTANGAIFVLRLSIQEAFAHKFPITFPAVETCKSVASPDLETFVTNLTAAISDLSERAKRLELQAEEIRQQAVNALQELVNRIEELMSVAEVALFSFPENDPRFEEARLQSLDSMKAVGRASFKVKELAFRKLRSDVRSLMRLLFDSVYLHLSQPTIPASTWNETKHAVSEKLREVGQWTV